MKQDEMLRYIMPSIEHRSVTSEDDFRVKMAKHQLNVFSQLDISKKSSAYIIKLVNEFLTKIGIGINSKFNNEVNVKSEKECSRGRVSYSEIQRNSGISCKQDIVWIKLNKNTCISVVGVGCDIFFTEKTKLETTAGKINTFLDQEWDEEKVLVFPLIGLKELGYNRSDIESGIGNYLITNGIPILDYYSHNY